MNLLAQLVDENAEEPMLDAEYQGNMYLIEDALRQLGHSVKPDFQASAYDAAIEKLIDSVPLE